MKRLVGVIIASNSDLPQIRPGLYHLMVMARRGDIELDPSVHNEEKDGEGDIAAASIEYVPDTQVVFKNESEEPFIGKSGATLACMYAVSGKLPIITLKEKSHVDIPLTVAVKKITRRI